MTLTVITPPANLLTSSDAVLRQFLRLEPDETDQDALIDTFCTVAVEKVEAYTRTRLFAQQIMLTLDRFGLCEMDWIGLQTTPITSVDQVRYLGDDGEWIVLDPDQYRVVDSHKPNLLAPKVYGTWPVARRGGAAVQVRLTVGYATLDDVPPMLMQGVRLLIAHMYANREPASGEAMPMHVTSMIAPFRVWI